MKRPSPHRWLTPCEWVLGIGLTGILVGLVAGSRLFTAWAVTGAATAVHGGPATSDTDLLVKLTLAGFTFTAGSYAWAWALFTRLEKRLSNELNHELQELRSHLQALETKMGETP